MILSYISFNKQCEFRNFDDLGGYQPVSLKPDQLPQSSLWFSENIEENFCAHKMQSNFAGKNAITENEALRMLKSY